MADPEIFLSVLLLFVMSNPALGVLSDYKICGDAECERLMSRVQATKDHKGPDCRFLSFRRGDVIFVYVKLTGKRDDLWAGTIDKQFGYFPKDAVEVEEIYASEEVKIPTQEHDFFCIDKYGTIIESDPSQQDNQEDQTELQEVPQNNEHHPEKSEPFMEPPTKIDQNEVQEKEEKTIVPASSHDSKQKVAEQGGSYWIGSRITGWLGLGGTSDDGSQEESKEQDSFRSRKLALDMDGNQLEKEATTEASGWLGAQLTNILSFGQRIPEDSVEKTNERGQLTNQNKDQPSMGTPNGEEAVIVSEDEDIQTSSWLKIGIGDILSFGQKYNDNGEVVQEGILSDTDQNEKIDTDNENTPSVDSAMSQAGVERDKKSVDVEEVTSDRGGSTEFNAVNSLRDNINLEEDSIVSEGTLTQADVIKNDERDGWYTSVYKSITGFYKEKPEPESAGETSSPENSEGVVNLNPDSDEENEAIQESGKGLQSVFSTSGISTVFDSLTSRFEPDTPDVDEHIMKNKYEESAADLADEVKEDLLESQTDTIDESKEGKEAKVKEENVDNYDYNINVSYLIQAGVETAPNDYEIQTKSEDKLATEGIVLTNNTFNPDLQLNSEDHSQESYHLDRGSEIDPISGHIESAIQSGLSDVSKKLQNSTEKINIQTEEGQHQLVEKPNDEIIENLFQTSDELVNEKHNTDIPDISRNSPDPAEKSTDQVITQHCGDEDIESTGTPKLIAPAPTLTEEKMFAEISDGDTTEIPSKVDTVEEDEESPAHQNKDYSSENALNPTTDHSTDRAAALHIDHVMDTLSTTESSVHKQVHEPGFRQMDVVDPITDGSETNIEQKDKNILNMIIYKKEDPKGEPSKIQENKENKVIDADVLKEELPEQKDTPAITINTEGSEIKISNTENAEEEFTSTGYNTEEESIVETDVSDDLGLKSIPNEQKLQVNQGSFLESTNVETSAHDSSDLSHKTDMEEHENKSQGKFAMTEDGDAESQVNESEEAVQKHERLSSEQLNITGDELVKEGQDVLPDQSLNDIKNSSRLIEENSGTKNLNIPVAENISDLARTEPNNLPDVTVDDTHKQTESQTDGNLKEVQPSNGFNSVNGDLELTDSQKTKEDSEYGTTLDGSINNEAIAITGHKQLPGSGCQTETCTDAVDVSQTSVEQQNTAELSLEINVDAAEGFSDIADKISTTEEDFFLAGSQVGEDNPNGKSSDQLTSKTGQFPSVLQADSISHVESSVINHKLFSDNGAEAEKNAHEINRGYFFQMYVNPQTQVPKKTKTTEGELLTEINGGVVQIPSDQNEGNNEISDVSDKEEGLSSSSYSKTSKSQSSAADQSSLAYLEVASHKAQMETTIKNMENTDHSKKDIGNISMKQKDETAEMSQQKEAGDEILPDPHPRDTDMQSQKIHSTKEAFKATNGFKEYKNIQVHLKGEDIQYLLALFGKHKLLWLDYCLSNTENGDEDKDNNLAIMSDFERLLEYHSEIETKMKEDDNHIKNVSLQKLKTLLSALRSRYTTEKPAVTVDVNQDTGRPECTTITCFSPEKSEHTWGETEAHHEMRKETDRTEWRSGHPRQADIDGITTTETGSRQTTANSDGTDTLTVNPSSQIPSESHWDAIFGTLLTFAGQLTIESSVHLLSFYSLLKWLITQVRNKQETV